jgi:hypothetical protein
MAHDLHSLCDDITDTLGIDKDDALTLLKATQPMLDESLTKLESMDGVTATTGALIHEINNQLCHVGASKLSQSFRRFEQDIHTNQLQFDNTLPLLHVMQMEQLTKAARLHCNLVKHLLAPEA